jgi:hypothetical protein
VFSLAHAVGDSRSVEIPGIAKRLQAARLARHDSISTITGRSVSKEGNVYLCSISASIDAVGRVHRATRVQCARNPMCFT